MIKNNLIFDNERYNNKVNKVNIVKREKVEKEYKE